MSNYPTYPKALIPAKYANLIAELSAAEELFAMRLGVTMNCGDVRLIRTSENRYVVQELRGKQYAHLSTHDNIAAAVIAFRAAVVGPANDTVEFDPQTGQVSIVRKP